MHSRREILRLAAFAGGAIATPTIVRAQGSRTLVFSHHLTATHVAHLAAERIAALVDQRTGGALKLEIRPAGQLFNLRTAAEAIQLGTLDLCWTDLATLGNWRPEFGFIGLPFLFTGYDHVRAVLQGPVGEGLSADVRTALGVEVLALGGSGFRVFLAKMPIPNAAACAGIKLRIPEVPVWVAMARALGAVPTPIPGPEIYTALQTGVIDAIEVPPDSIVGRKLYEVAGHSSRTFHMFTEASIMANGAVIDSLGEAGAVLRAAAREVVHGWMWGENIREQSAAWATTAANTQAIEEPDRESFRAAVRPVIDDFVAANGEAGARYVGAVAALG
ncbi:MAG: TRAP transporter substrate-binding protein [Rhodobacteraceae bacterium]|jgi:tripartite ATP-independent transporter DctP family solute receptor|nr:TRAP transporter substrate-binding protein [Paracoccaceae bacterium]